MCLRPLAFVNTKLVDRIQKSAAFAILLPSIKFIS